MPTQKSELRPQYPLPRNPMKTPHASTLRVRRETQALIAKAVEDGDYKTAQLLRRELAKGFVIHRAETSRAATRKRYRELVVASTRATRRECEGRRFEGDRR